MTEGQKISAGVIKLAMYMLERNFRAWKNCSTNPDPYLLGDLNTFCTKQLIFTHKWTLTDGAFFTDGKGKIFEMGAIYTNEKYERAVQMLIDLYLQEEGDTLYGPYNDSTCPYDISKAKTWTLVCDPDWRFEEKITFDLHRLYEGNKD